MSTAAGAAPAPLRFAILGNGAIAAEILRLVAERGGHAGPTPSLDFVGTVSRDPATLDAALAQADVIVEAASVGAVREFGPRIVAAGIDIVVASVGAFAAPDALSALRAAGTGRVHLTSGAIGGLDVLAAAGRTGGLDEVLVRSRKLPASLVQDWMSEAERSDLLALTAPQTLFSGTPAEAIEHFPSSLNVAVAVGLAVGNDSLVRVELVADPAASLTEHAISASGPAGEYVFTIRNAPLPARPASSGLTARALVAELLQLAEAR